MAFSYTLFLALLLLAPGLAFWAGSRLGESRQILSPASDKPGSTTTLLTIVVGALLGHLALAAIFALQSLWCEFSNRCIEIGFDPNVYRVLLSEHRTLPSDAGVAAWFLTLLFPALLLGICAWRLARSERFGRLVGPTTFGWLWPIVEEARAKKGTILAYVVTTLNYESRSVGYEGAVEQVAFDDNKGVAMLVLSGCDRFLVDIPRRMWCESTRRAKRSSFSTLPRPRLPTSHSKCLHPLRPRKWRSPLPLALLTAVTSCNGS